MSGLITELSSGIFFGLLRPAGTSFYDIVVRRVSIGWYNEGSANPNIFAVGRSLALPAANVAESGTIGQKSTQSPAPTARIYVKPTGVTLTTAEMRAAEELVPKTNVAAAVGFQTFDLASESEPYVLGAGESLVGFQELPGLFTEQWYFALEWSEVVF